MPKKPIFAGVDDNELPEAETKIFRSGNSDAVRLPKGFIRSGVRVKVRKLIGGDILISPLTRRKWPKGFFENLGRLSDDFEIPPRDPPDPDYEKRMAHLFDWDDAVSSE